MCLRYEQIKKQLKRMIMDARTLQEGCESSKSQEYWKAKQEKLMEAYRAIEAAQYMKKPEMK